MITIALVDDHPILRKGLAGLTQSFGYQVLFEAENGKDFISKLDPQNLPQLVLLDTGMPVMDGYETAQWLRHNYPALKILALSLDDKEESVFNMLKHGAKAYLLKGTTPLELKTAINAVIVKGHYYSNLLSYRSPLLNTLSDNDPSEYVVQLSDRETEFLKHVCTELTYKEIAARMYVSPRTIDNYREALFEKLNVKSRTGLCIYAIKHGIVEI